MARGIEHREKESVIQAYELDNKPNWALFSGTEPVITYEGGSMADGADKLRDYLGILEDSPTKTVFTLRVYHDGTTRITNKTAYAGSTTLMLNGDVSTSKDPVTGMMIVDRYPHTNKVSGTGNEYTALMERLEKLETTNASLLQQLHNQQIKGLEERLNMAISGLTDRAPSRLDKILDAIIERPEMIPKTIGNIIDIFRPQAQNYFHTQPVAGTFNDTDNTEQQPNEMGQTETIKFKEYTPEELDKIHDQQSELCDNIEERVGVEPLTLHLTSLAALPDEMLYQWWDQERAMNLLRSRLKPDVLTKMVQTVANLNDKDLGKLLNHLD